MPHATILVVDDEQLIRWSMVERLRADGYDVLEAGTGGEGIELAKTGSTSRCSTTSWANAAQPYGVNRIVGESPRIRELKALLRRVASSPASTVLLTGESGTGKISPPRCGTTTARAPAGRS